MVKLKIKYGFIGIKEICFDGDSKHFHELIEILDEKKRIKQAIEEEIIKNTLENGASNNI